MRSKEDIEAYLLKGGLPFEATEDGVFVVRDPSWGERTVVTVAGPLVVFSVKVMPLEGVSDRAGLFEALLRLNANEMLHGAYGIDEDAVLLTCTLRLENLDYNEFQGTLDDFSVALTGHYETLSAYRGGGGKEA